MVKVKLKKKEGEAEAPASTPSGEGKELSDMVAGLNRVMKKIEGIKGIDLEFDEIILEGVIPPYELLAKLLSGGAPAAAPVAEAVAAEEPKKKITLEPFKLTPPIEEHPGKFAVVTLGGGNRAFTLKVGGNNAPPYFRFEGNLPERPPIAHVVFDEDPGLSKVLREQYGDVVGDPVAWAKKLVDVYGAKVIVLDLNSTDPKGSNRSADEAAATLKDVLAAVDVPVGIVLRSGNMAKDVEVVRACAEAAKGENIFICSTSLVLPTWVGVELDDEVLEYYEIAKEYDHTVVSYQPMNAQGLAWLNKTALTGKGIPPEKVMTDPGLVCAGFGTELVVTTMDTVNNKALIGDENFQPPMITAPCNAWLNRETWNKFEEWGSEVERGTAFECATAAAALASGAHILVMLSQRSIEATEALLDKIYLTKPEDTKAVLRHLPKNDCKKCGYDTCEAMAEALLKGETTVEKCEQMTPAGIRTLNRLLNPEGVKTDPAEIANWIVEV
ncbi:MAG: acetyl-CoA synthase subunit delta [Candidatus Syntrophoarchaeum caldarius]|uniref:Acetyl-CoA synthase subunit delta n=1 Tax=Candidatus Syntropharchaeum caldarium TaxID=1838285 RepID=A0A1F2P9B6_9EURY|nr:MAG: acetyl-CoA synthase subunit delta [Candidatus Syntrophoarchaeum caldarius]